MFTIFTMFLISQPSFAAEVPKNVTHQKSLFEYAYPLIPIFLSTRLIEFGSEDGKTKKFARYLMLTGALTAVTEVAQLATEFGMPSTVADCTSVVMMFIPRRFIDTRIEGKVAQTTFRQIMGLFTGMLLSKTGASYNSSRDDALPALFAVSNEDKSRSVTAAVGSEAATKVLETNQLNDLAANLEAARGETTWLSTMFVLRESMLAHYESRGFNLKDANVQAGTLLTVVGSLIRYMATNSDVGFAGEVVVMSGLYSLLDAMQSGVKTFICQLTTTCWEPEYTPWLVVLLELTLSVPFDISRPLDPIVTNLPGLLYVMQRSLVKIILARTAIHVSTALSPQIMSFLSYLVLSSSNENKESTLRVQV